MLVKETWNFYTFGMCFLAFLTCGAHRGFVLNSASVVTVFVQKSPGAVAYRTHTHWLERRPAGDRSGCIVSTYSLLGAGSRSECQARALNAR